MNNSSLLKALLGVSLVLALQACNLPSKTQTAGTPSAATAPARSGGGACSNTLYPVAKGATWIYSLSGTATDTISHSITDVTADGFTDQDVFASGLTRTGKWKCQNGALIALSPPAGPSSAVTANNLSASFTTTDMSGVTLPADVKPGDTWSQDFTVEGVQSLSGQQVPTKGKVTFDCTAGATESTTVAAGTFGAQRVDCKIKLDISVNFGGIEIPTSFSGDATTWYAPGVGLVKMDGSVPNIGTSSLELTAYHIP